MKTKKPKDDDGKKDNKTVGKKAGPSTAKKTISKVKKPATASPSKNNDNKSISSPNDDEVSKDEKEKSPPKSLPAKKAFLKKYNPKINDNLKEKERKIQKTLKKLGVNISDKTINQIDTSFLLKTTSDGECNPSICEMVKTKARAVTSLNKNQSGCSSPGTSTPGGSGVKSEKVSGPKIEKDDVKEKALSESEKVKCTSEKGKTSEAKNEEKVEEATDTRVSDTKSTKTAKKNVKEVEDKEKPFSSKNESSIEKTENKNKKASAPKNVKITKKIEDKEKGCEGKNESSTEKIDGNVFDTKTTKTTNKNAKEPVEKQEDLKKIVVENRKAPVVKNAKATKKNLKDAEEKLKEANNKFDSLKEKDDDKEEKINDKKEKVSGAKNVKATKKNAKETDDKQKAVNAKFDSMKEKADEENIKASSAIISKVTKKNNKQEEDTEKASNSKSECLDEKVEDQNKKACGTKNVKVVKKNAKEIEDKEKALDKNGENLNEAVKDKNKKASCAKNVKVTKKNFKQIEEIVKASENKNEEIEDKNEKASNTKNVKAAKKNAKQIEGKEKALDNKSENLNEVVKDKSKKFSSTKNVKVTKKNVKQVEEKEHSYDNGESVKVDEASVLENMKMTIQLDEKVENIEKVIGKTNAKVTKNNQKTTTNIEISEKVGETSEKTNIKPASSKPKVLKQKPVKNNSGKIENKKIECKKIECEKIENEKIESEKIEYEKIENEKIEKEKEQDKSESTSKTDKGKTNVKKKISVANKKHLNENIIKNKQEYESLANEKKNEDDKMKNEEKCDTKNTEKESESKEITDGKDTVEDMDRKDKKKDSITTLNTEKQTVVKEVKRKNLATKPVKKAPNAVLKSKIKESKTVIGKIEKVSEKNQVVIQEIKSDISPKKSPVKRKLKEIKDKDPKEQGKTLTLHVEAEKDSNVKVKGVEKPIQTNVEQEKRKTSTKKTLMAKKKNEDLEKSVIALPNASFETSGVPITEAPEKEKCHLNNKNNDCKIVSENPPQTNKSSATKPRRKYTKKKIMLEKMENLPQKMVSNKDAKMKEDVEENKIIETKEKVEENTVKIPVIKKPPVCKESTANIEDKIDTGNSSKSVATKKLTKKQQKELEAFKEKSEPVSVPVTESQILTKAERSKENVSKDSEEAEKEPVKLEESKPLSEASTLEPTEKPLPIVEKKIEENLPTKDDEKCKSSTENDEDLVPLKTLKEQQTKTTLAKNKKPPEKQLNSKISELKRKYVRKNPKNIKTLSKTLSKPMTPEKKDPAAVKDIYEFDDYESDIESKLSTEKPIFKRKTIEPKPATKSVVDKKDKEEDIKRASNKKPKLEKQKAKSDSESEEDDKDRNDDNTKKVCNKKPIKMAKKEKKKILDNDTDSDHGKKVHGKSSNKKVKVSEDEETSADETDSSSTQESVRTRIVKKRMSAKNRHLKLYGFYSGPKRHRVASLNALAKVHCLYENETRSALESNLIKFITPKPQKEPEKTVKESKCEKEKPEKVVAKSLEAKDDSEDEDDEDYEDEEKAEVSTRTLRCVPGLRGVGKHWEMDGSSLGSSSDESMAGSDESYNHGKEGDSKKKKAKKNVAAKKAKLLAAKKLEKEKGKEKNKEKVKEKTPKSKPIKKEKTKTDIEKNEDSSSSASNSSVKPKKNEPKKRKHSEKSDAENKQPAHPKRMASLNASAMLAATYEVERFLSRHSGDSDHERKSTSVKKAKEIKEEKLEKPIKEEEKKEEEKKVIKDEIEEPARPVSSSVVIVQDTDVTITGVYVNSSLGANQEAYCKMQYRVQSSVTEERVLRQSEQPPKSYTPLSALSSMRPPNDPSLSTPPLFTQPPECDSPLSQTFYPPPNDGRSFPLPYPPPTSSAFCPPHHDNSGYYQAAGPLITSPHLLPPQVPQPQLIPQQSTQPPTKASTSPQDPDSLPSQPGAPLSVESDDNDVMITGGDVPRPQTYRYGPPPQPPGPNMYSRPVHQMHCAYPPNYYSPYSQHHQEMCYSPSYYANYPKMYPPMYGRRYITDPYYQPPPPPPQPRDLYEPQPPSAPPPPPSAQIVPAQGPPQHMEHYPGPHYGYGYSPAGGQCYPRNIQPPYMDTPYTNSCPCPMQSCPKNVNTGPLIGIKASKGPVTTSQQFVAQSVEPIIISSGSSSASSTSSSVEIIPEALQPQMSEVIQCKTEPTITVPSTTIAPTVKTELLDPYSIVHIPYTVSSKVLLDLEMPINPARGSTGLPTLPLMMQSELQETIKLEIKQEDIICCKKEDYEADEKLDNDDKISLIKSNNDLVEPIIDNFDGKDKIVEENMKKIDNQTIVDEDKSLSTNILPADSNNISNNSNNVNISDNNNVDKVQLDETLPELPPSTVKRRKLLANCKIMGPKKSPPNSYKNLIKRTSTPILIQDDDDCIDLDVEDTTPSDVAAKKPKLSDEIENETVRMRLHDETNDNAETNETIVIADTSDNEGRTSTLSHAESIASNIDLTIDLVAKGYFSEPEMAYRMAKSKTKTVKKFKLQEARSQSEQSRKQMDEKAKKSKKNIIENSVQIDENKDNAEDAGVVLQTTDEKSNKCKKVKEIKVKNKVMKRKPKKNNQHIKDDIQKDEIVENDVEMDIIKDANSIVETIAINNNNTIIENNNNVILNGEETVKSVTTATTPMTLPPPAFEDTDTEPSVQITTTTQQHTVNSKRSRSKSKKFSMKKRHKTATVTEIEEVLPSRKSTSVPRWSNGWTWEGQSFQGKVFLNSDDPPVLRTCYPAMRHSEGDVIRPRDCVFLRAGTKRCELPFVAKVAHLWENPEDGEMMLSLLWYYRPEHTDQGRKSGDSPDEVFASRHKDHNSVACIEDKCYVLTYNEYCRYRRHIKAIEERVEEVQIVPPVKRENHRYVPPHTSLELVLYCKRIYEFRKKRICEEKKL